MAIDRCLLFSKLVCGYCFDLRSLAPSPADTRLPVVPARTAVQESRTPQLRLAGTRGDARFRGIVDQGVRATPLGLPGRVRKAGVRPRSRSTSPRGSPSPRSRQPANLRYTCRGRLFSRVFELRNCRARDITLAGGVAFEYIFGGRSHL